MSERAPIIGLLGAGNMASAMVSGWVRADGAMAERILVTDRGSGRAAALAERLGVRHVEANADLVREADIVVLCVKPIDVERVLREVSDLITPKKMVASVAAGVGTATLETILDVDAPVFRFMPNVGVRVGAGHARVLDGALHGHRRRGDRARSASPCSARSCRSRSGSSTRRRRSRARGRRSSASSSRRSRMPASSSGLTHESARRLILSTVRGTAELLAAENLACADLRRMVTSPGGTAAAGLAEMERRGVRGAIIDGVSAARHRAGELG